MLLCCSSSSSPSSPSSPSPSFTSSFCFFQHKKERIKAKGYRAEALVINAARAQWESNAIARLKQAGRM